jgi:hypothetical protein
MNAFLDDLDFYILVEDKLSCFPFLFASNTAVACFLIWLDL